MGGVEGVGDLRFVVVITISGKPGAERILIIFGIL